MSAEFIESVNPKYCPCCHYSKIIRSLAITCEKCGNRKVYKQNMFEDRWAKFIAEDANPDDFGENLECDEHKYWCQDCCEEDAHHDYFTCEECDEVIGISCKDKCSKQSKAKNICTKCYNE